MEATVHPQGRHRPPAGSAQLGSQCSVLTARKPDSPTSRAGLAGEDTWFPCSFSKLAPGGCKALNAGWTMPKKGNLSTDTVTGGDEPVEGSQKARPWSQVHVTLRPHDLALAGIGCGLSLGSPSGEFVFEVLEKPHHKVCDVSSLLN